MNPGAIDHDELREAVSASLAFTERLAAAIERCESAPGPVTVGGDEDAVVEACKQGNPTTGCAWSCVIETIEHRALLRAREADAFVSALPAAITSRPDCDQYERPAELLSCLGISNSAIDPNRVRVRVHEAGHRTQILDVIANVELHSGLFVTFEGRHMDIGCDLPPVWATFVHLP